MNWGVVSLVVMAVCSVVQAVILIGLAISGRRLASRLQVLQDRVDREIRPTIDSLSRIARNLAEVSDTAVLQARRIDELLADTVEKIEETTSTLRRVILRPLAPLVDIVAFLKGVRRGLEVYYRLRGFERQRHAPARRHAEDDEHLFI